MLRELKNQLNGRSADTLPATSFGSGSASKSSRWSIPLQGKRGRPNDGSAASIDTTPQIQRTWQRTSVHTRATWISVLSGFVMIWLGWRWVRYNSAGIILDCDSVSCDLKVTPIGWAKRVHLPALSRHQLVNAVAVKVARDGSFVTDQNVVVIDPYHPDQKKNYKKSSSYKGPDDDGLFLSYAIVVQDVSIIHDPNNNAEDAPIVPDADLTPLLKYMDEMPASSPSNEGTDQHDTQSNSNNKQYRLIPHKFGVRESKRRVRTMIQKLESYVKRRRQKLVVREYSAPAWQGVVLMVVGTMTFFIALALGQFSDAQPSTVVYGTKHRGPGVRRNQAPPPHRNSTPSYSSSRQRDTIQEAYQVSTPSQYEVRTSSSAPAAPPSNSGSAKRSNATGAAGTSTYRRR